MKLPWKGLQTKKRACLRNNIIPWSSLSISFLYAFLILFFFLNWIFFYFLLCWRKWYQIFMIPHMSHFWSPRVPKSDFSGTHSLWHSCSYHCLGTFPWGWLFFCSQLLSPWKFLSFFGFQCTFFCPLISVVWWAEEKEWLCLLPCFLFSFY